ncbi:MAG: DUF3791 domain-containing protein [Clostridiales Family XIII bacterium]|jgi:hypothetical protein|nr:DUF3791 domain-containing protein [Clostridiales Family XIII bacterium]
MNPVLEFVVFCVEEYKYATKSNGREVMFLFNKYGVIDYIRQFYGALHTTSPDYIVGDINAYIAKRSA